MSRVCQACQHVNEDAAQFCGRCGHKFDGPVLAIGSTLDRGRYRLEKLLGEGGMGSVWQAQDTKLGRAVALKCLAPELTAHPTARRRMEQEAKILARVEHPNIVQVRNVFDESGLLVMELELVSGGDLESMVRPGGAAEKDVLTRMVKALAGLEALHGAGLVHRDIKPANVLLTDGGEPKITDLGVAHDPTAREKTRLGASLGTPDYMSPEQIKGLQVDARSDLYSTGVMAFQLLAGELPFVGNSEFDIHAAHVREPPDLDRLRASASPAVVAWVARALEKDPAARWQSATEMREAAQRILAGEVGAASARSAPASASTSPAPTPATSASAPAAAASDAADPPRSVAAAPQSTGGGGGMGMVIAGVAVAALAGFGWTAMRSEKADGPVADEAAEVAIPTNEAPALQPAAAPAEPVADEPEPHWVPSFRRGDRWRFRYQKIPADTDDAWRTRDHIVERKVERVEQVGSGVAVHILEVGGPADQEERRFAEYYGTDGIGGLSGGVPEIRGEWSSASPSSGDVAVTLPTGSTEKLGSSPLEYWIHAKLGKVAEAVTDQKGDTYKLTLIAYDVGGEKAGNMDGEVQRCVWTNRFSKAALEPFKEYSMQLRGLGHTYLEAKGSTTPFGSGWLSFEGGNGATPHRIADRGVLVSAKAWITPSRGEWVAAIWWSEEKTSLTLTHLTGSIARTFALQFDSTVENQDRLWRDHSLLLLQRGEQCVVGIKAKGKGGKKWALALVPDDDDGTVQPRLIAGDWQ